MALVVAAPEIEAALVDIEVAPLFEMAPGLQAATRLVSGR